LRDDKLYPRLAESVLLFDLHMIEDGRSIKIATDAQARTVADLFQGYAASLKAAGKPSWK
jgi:hypothetical protein